MFSPNYLLFGLLGSGITGISLMTIWLTSGDREAKLNIQEEIKKRCGNDVWWNEVQTLNTHTQKLLKENNDKGMNMSQYSSCVKEHNNELARKKNSSKSTGQE